jgi:hypothetical protein
MRFSLLALILPGAVAAAQTAKTIEIGGAPKCANCGVLIYGPGMPVERNSKPLIFCSDWCIEWSQKRDSGTKDMRLRLPKASTGLS